MASEAEHPDEGRQTSHSNLLSGVALTQRKQSGEYGCTDYVVVVEHTRPDGTTEELLHEYCSYHPQAGPVRPDPVVRLHLDGASVKWEWSENAFDVASPGATFVRALTLDGASLAWAGPVLRMPKVKATPPVPNLPAGALALVVEDVTVETESSQQYGQDEVRVRVSHNPTGSSLLWNGTSTAESQSITGLRTSAAGGHVMVQFEYRTAENGDRYASTVTLFVRRKAASDGIEWGER